MTGAAQLPRKLKGFERRRVISRSGHNSSLIVEADQALARGDVQEAASLLELAAQRGRDSSTLLRLATIRRSMGDLSGAIQAASAAVELAPRNFVMSLLLGSLREATGAIHAAERAYRMACRVAPLDLSFQAAMAKQLDRARSSVEAASRWRKRLFDWQPAPDCGLTPDEDRRLRGFRSNILENLDAGPLTPPLFLLPGIRGKKYFEPSSFPGLSDLEAATGGIRDEFLGIAEGLDLKLVQSSMGNHATRSEGSSTGKWSMIPLIRNGVVVEEFASRCPLTIALASQLGMPRLGFISPSLYFSVLEPGSRIAPHSGITNARVIAHLPLIVPNRCGFRVGGETREWEVGRAMVFDDITTHEAWNDSSETRVVLIADLWRPELSVAERRGVEELMDCAGLAPQA
jgi:hypothetical protein